jgi:hypothetical protein
MAVSTLQPDRKSATDLILVTITSTVLLVCAGQAEMNVDLASGSS